MDRRRFVGFIALGVAVAPIATSAQQSARVARIGVLAVPSLESPEMQRILSAFREGLRERGYVEKQNIVIEYRSAGGSFEQVPGLVRDLSHLNVAVIVVGASQVARIVQRATTTIPIVAIGMGDPIEDGLAASLARPGGNVTGLIYQGPELVLKRLELVKQMLPSASRVAGLWQRSAVSERSKELLDHAEVVSRAMGVRLQLVEFRGARELDEAFSAIAQEHPDALVLLRGGLLVVEHRRIVALAAKHRIPTMGFGREFVAVGGLSSYGPDIADSFRRSAAYVDRILKGAKPGDLPIEQPTKFELVINLKTAKALGLTFPQSILSRADEVIQ